MHINHNTLHFDLCRESKEKIINGLELFSQERPGKTLAIWKSTKFLATKYFLHLSSAFSNYIHFFFKMCFVALIHQIMCFLASISFLLSTFSSPYIPDSVLSNPIYFSFSALSNPHPSDNVLSSPIFFLSRMFSTPRILNSIFSSPISFLSSVFSSPHISDNALSSLIYFLSEYAFKPSLLTLFKGLTIYWSGESTISHLFFFTSLLSKVSYETFYHKHCKDETTIIT